MIIFWTTSLNTRVGDQNLYGPGPSAENYEVSISPEHPSKINSYGDITEASMIPELMGLRLKRDLFM